MCNFTFFQLFFVHLRVICTLFNAAYRCILAPFERYGAPKNAPKKFKKYSLRILKNKSLSRDTNILQMHWTSNKFLHSATAMGGGGEGGGFGCLNYPILNFKKTVCSKKVWMQHCFFIRIPCMSSYLEYDVLAANIRCSTTWKWNMR